MALTPSTMLPLGTLAPDFQLPDVVSGEKVSLSSFASDIFEPPLSFCAAHQIGISKTG
jgi:hypothetical protein